VGCLCFNFLFQVGFKHTAIISGMMLIPSAITTIMVKPWVVPIVKKLGYKNTDYQYNSYCYYYFIICCTRSEYPLPLLIPLLVIYGAVNSIQLATMNTLSLSDLDNKNASNGNSLLMVMQQLSMSFKYLLEPTF
jgi:hypothetical protein